MALTSKQRSTLKGLASKENTIFHIGKNSLSPEMIEGIDQALEKRELVKLGVLKNCGDDPRELAEIVAGRTRSEVVTVIGKKIVLYRSSKNGIITI